MLKLQYFFQYPNFINERQFLLCTGNVRRNILTLLKYWSWYHFKCTLSLGIITKALLFGIKPSYISHQISRRVWENQKTKQISRGAKLPVKHLLELAPIFIPYQKVLYEILFCLRQHFFKLFYMENLGKPGAIFQSDRECHVIYDLHHKK